MGLGFTYVTRPLAGEIIGALDITRAQFSAGNGPQLFAQAMASPLVGYLTVRMGASRVFGFSAALFTAAFLYFASIESLTGLYVSMAMLGLGAAGMGDIGVGHIVSQWVKRSRGLALGLAYTGSNLGGALWVGLTIPVAEQASWREAFMVLAAISFFVMLPVMLFVVREPPASRSISDPTEDSEVREVAAVPNDDEQHSMNLKQAVRTRSFWLLTATLFTFFFYQVGVLDHLVLFLTDSGMDRSEAAGYFSAAVFLGIFSKVILGLIADRMSHKASILLDYALVAASSVVLIMLPSPALIWVFVVSFGFSTAARDVVYPLIIGHCFGVRYIGEIYGAMMLILMAGGALGPIWAATIHDSQGSYQTAFLAFIVLNLLSLGALVFVRNERPATAAQAP